MKPSPVQLAWAAGLFDGEGSISIHRQSRPEPRLRLNLRLVMTDMRSVEMFQRSVAAGIIRSTTPRPPRKPAFRWYCEMRNLRRVLESLRPFLVTKQEECLLALYFLDEDTHPDDAAGVYGPMLAKKLRGRPRTAPPEAKTPAKAKKKAAGKKR